MYPCALKQRHFTAGQAENTDYAPTTQLVSGNSLPILTHQLHMVEWTLSTVFFFACNSPFEAFSSQPTCHLEGGLTQPLLHTS